MATGSHRLHRYGFPSAPALVSPSARLLHIERLKVAVSVLSLAVAVAICMNVVLSIWMLKTVDAEAYVADGGIFGCRVPVLTQPLPEDP